MVVHHITAPIKHFVGEGLERFWDGVKKDVKKASEFALPISIPLAVGYTVWRGALFGAGFAAGLIFAFFGGAFQDDIKKQFQKWIEKRTDNFAGKILDGLDYGFTSGSNVFEKILPWNLFSAKKKPPRAKADTGKGSDAGLETDSDEEIVAPKATERDDIIDTSAADNNRVAGLDPTTGEDLNNRPSSITTPRGGHSHLAGGGLQH